MATPRRRSSRIKGETPVSKQQRQQSPDSLASLLRLYHGREIHTDVVIVSTQCCVHSKQAILPPRARRVSSKPRPTLPQHPCLLTSRPSEHFYGARPFRWSAIASQKPPDSFSHTAIWGRNAPKQSPSEYRQTLSVSSGLRRHLFSNDWFSFQTSPHSAPSAYTVEIERLLAWKIDFTYLRL